MSKKTTRSPEELCKERSEYFKVIAEKRTNRILKELDGLKSFAKNTSVYEYTEEQAQQNISAIQGKLDEVEGVLLSHGKSMRFSLSADLDEFELP